MALNKPIDSYDSVKTWLKGLAEQSGIDPAGDPLRLRLLAEFCAFVDRDPDEVVQACLLVKEGRDTKISIKGRRGMAEKIAEFQAASGAELNSRERGKRGNTIRSFLIHNGILLQAGMQV
ncbi:MAG: hypothetical protein WA005_05375 [Candidatus Binataceae bacterium]